MVSALQNPPTINPAARTDSLASPSLPMRRWGRMVCSRKSSGANAMKNFGAHPACVFFGVSPAPSPLPPSPSRRGGIILFSLLAPLVPALPLRSRCAGGSLRAPPRARNERRVSAAPRSANCLGCPSSYFFVVSFPPARYWRQNLSQKGKHVIVFPFACVSARHSLCLAPLPAWRKKKALSSPIFSLCRPASFPPARSRR